MIKTLIKVDLGKNYIRQFLKEKKGNTELVKQVTKKLPFHCVKSGKTGEGFHSVTCEREGLFHLLPFSAAVVFPVSVCFFHGDNLRNRHRAGICKGHILTSDEVQRIHMNT